MPNRFYLFNTNSSLLLESPRKWTILGLNLMYLLANNRLSDFHTELELIPMKSRAEPSIAFPVELEQRLMEGSFGKVLSLKKSVPSTYYAFFMNALVETVRERISECSMKAYDFIPVSEGKKLLMLESDKKVQEYADKRGWKIAGGKIEWNVNVSSSLVMNSKDVIEETLAYATELERIV